MKDKTKHFYGGFFIGIIFGTILYYGITKDILLSGFVGFTSAVIAGAIKELIYDKVLKKGTATLADFLYTIWGGLCGSLITMAILNTIK